MTIKKRVYMPIIIIAVLIFLAYAVFNIPKVPEVPDKNDGLIRVMSYNLRYGTSDYDQWLGRKNIIAGQILRYQPDSMGIQEGDSLWMNLTEGLPGLLDGYSYVGVGRDDGIASGEFNAIFYLKDKYEMVESGTFWLSGTPDTPSYGWDAACRRICTWAVLRNMETGETYAHYNTHLDHEGKEAREKGAELILQKLEESEYPYVVTGDFNLLQGSKVYREIIRSGLLFDSKKTAGDSMRHGTMNWFLPLNFRLLPPIDFCFVSKEIAVETYRVDNTYRIGRKPVSDHFPVIIDINYD